MQAWASEISSRAHFKPSSRLGLARAWIGWAQWAQVGAQPGTSLDMEKYSLFWYREGFLHTINVEGMKSSVYLGQHLSAVALQR